MKTALYGLAVVLAVVLIYAYAARSIQYGSVRDMNTLPNPSLTPGATNPSVTQANIKSTICVSGWTMTIRPPVAYTNKLKVEQIAQYDYPDATPKDYEEDHLISLELGGNPTNPLNLWPESYPLAHTKDSVENQLHKAVCDGSLTLAAAQYIIATDWYTYYNKHKTFGAIQLSDDPDDN